MGSAFIDAKAKSLVERGKVQILGAGKYRIHFRVKTDKIHNIFFDKRDNTWHCDCKYYMFRKKTCSHIKSAMHYFKKILAQIII